MQEIKEISQTQQHPRMSRWSRKLKWRSFYFPLKFVVCLTDKSTFDQGVVTDTERKSSTHEGVVAVDSEGSRFAICQRCFQLSEEGHLQEYETFSTNAKININQYIRLQKLRRSERCDHLLRFDDLPPDLQNLWTKSVS